MRSPRDFFRPLALGAPAPLRDIPVRPSRMIHFFDPSNAKMVEKAPDIAKRVDILLGNLEDAIAIDNKQAAREGFIQIARNNDFGDTQLWTRINSLDSPWFLDDITRIVTGGGRQGRCHHATENPGRLGYPLRRPTPRPTGSKSRTEKAHPAALPAGDRAGRGQCGRDRQRQPAHPGNESRPC